VNGDLHLWQARWAEQARRLRAEGRFRALGQGQDASFCHNDYLGLRRDPRLILALHEALEANLPTTASGSRLLSGNLDRFERFENEFAGAAGFPRALLFGSASEANRAVISALAGRHDTVFHDELAHASLIDGILQSGAMRKRFRHNDPEDLRAQIRNHPAKGIRLVVTESVFSMDGDCAPLIELLEVCNEEAAMLLVDEAHAVGLFGNRRTGLSEGLPKNGALVATTHGFGKALASSGGILCTAPEVVDAIVNTSRAFIFTTAPSPLAVVAAEAAWGIAQTDTPRQEALRRLCNVMQNGLNALGWDVPGRGQTPIFPLLCGGLDPAVRLSKSLHSSGIPLGPIRPPTVPEGSERLRATVSADLSDADITHFLEILHAH